MSRSLFVSRLRSLVRAIPIAVIALLAATSAVLHANVQDFSVDPKWEGVGNRPDPMKCVTTVENFGFDARRQAAGGLFSRSLHDAFYGKTIGALTLDRPLTASGTFTVPAMDNGSVFLGWFNPAEGTKPANFLGLRIMAQGSVGGELHGDPWIWTATWRGHGTKLAIKLDTAKDLHRFELSYEPRSTTLRAVIDDRDASFPLPAGFAEDGARFSHFGMFNTMWSPQATITVFFDDLRFTGEAGELRESFERDPMWSARGNRVPKGIRDCKVQANQDFGWSPARQAIGGLFFRTDPSDRKMFYGTRTRPVTLATRLEMSGTVRFTSQMVDSGVYIGWFNHATVNELVPKGFVGLLIEGLTVDGHMIRPIYVTDAGTWNYWVTENVERVNGPVVRPDGQAWPWRLVYDPNDGSLVMTFRGMEYRYALRPEHRREGATMNRFGIFPYRWYGGGPLEIYFDDLSIAPTP